MPAVEYRVVEHMAQGCFLCRSANGPFLDFMLSLPEIPTPNGPVPLEQEIGICIGSKDTPGCLPQMIRVAGGADPFQFADLTASWADYKDEANKAIAELTKALEDSRAKEGVKVVPLDEVLDAVRS